MSRGKSGETPALSRNGHSPIAHSTKEPVCPDMSKLCFDAPGIPRVLGRGFPCVNRYGRKGTVTRHHPVRVERGLGGSADRATGETSRFSRPPLAQPATDSFPSRFSVAPRLSARTLTETTRFWSLLPDLSHDASATVLSTSSVRPSFMHPSCTLVLGPTSRAVFHVFRPLIPYSHR